MSSAPSGNGFGQSPSFCESWTQTIEKSALTNPRAYSLFTIEPAPRLIQWRRRPVLVFVIEPNVGTLSLPNRDRETAQR